MRGEHDGRAVAMQIGEKVDDLVPGAHIDTGGRLVENEQFWLAMEGASEEYPLLLAAGEFTYVPVFETAESELVKEFRHLLAFRLAGTLSIPLGRSRHQDDFAHRDGEIPVHRFDLGNVRDPKMSPAPHHALAGPQISKDQAQQRGLSRS